MEDHEKLGLFVARVEELANYRLLKRGFKAHLTLHVQSMTSWMIAENMVDEEDLRSFLLHFRKFFANKELVFVNHIFNICMKELQSDTLKDGLKEARRQWSEALKLGPFELRLRDETWTPEYITDLLINGYYFHDDPDKRKALNSIPAPAIPLTRHVFRDHLIVALNYVHYVRNVIVAATREKQFSWS